MTGELFVAEQGPQDGPAVLVIPGITATHRAWAAVARELSDQRILAPDLRGRGRSRGLPGPYGLRRHAEDLERVLDARGVGEVVVAGHSMGAFVAVMLAARAPQRVRSLVLVDGGIPLERPEGLDDATRLQTVLGPAAERLRMTFPDPAAYRAFWRRHPAFARDWTPDVAAYADYDLVAVGGALRPSTVVEAADADGLELYGPDWYLDALRGLRMPVTVIRAPLGLLAEPPGLYPSGRLDAAVDLVPQLQVVEVPDVNHYTIVMTDPGAARVAAAVRATAADRPA